MKADAAFELADGTRVYEVEGAYWRFLVVPSTIRLSQGAGPGLRLQRFANEVVQASWLILDAELSPEDAVLGALDEMLRGAVVARHQAAEQMRAAKEVADGPRRWKVVSGLRGADPTAPTPGGPAPAPVLDGHVWWRGEACLTLPGASGGPWRVPIDGGEARASFCERVDEATADRLEAAILGAEPLDVALSFEVSIQPTRAPFVGAPDRAEVSVGLDDLLAGLDGAERAAVVEHIDPRSEAAAGMWVSVQVDTDWACNAGVEVALRREDGQVERQVLRAGQTRWTRFERERVRDVRWRVCAAVVPDAAAEWGAWSDWGAVHMATVLLRPRVPQLVEVAVDTGRLGLGSAVLQADLTVRLEDTAGRVLHTFDRVTLREEDAPPIWQVWHGAVDVRVSYRVDYLLADGMVVGGPGRGQWWRQPLGAAGVLIEVPAPAGPRG